MVLRMQVCVRDIKTLVILSVGEAGVRDLMRACGADEADGSAWHACSVGSLLDWW
jgi:hypothetical protein